MTEQNPIKAIIVGGKPIGFGEFISTDSVGIANGGTGATTISGALLSLGLDKVLNVKNNFEAITTPTVNDDSTSGYDVGSHWLDTTSNTIYYCAEPTISGSIWRDITGGGGAVDALTYQGAWNAATNLPVLLSSSGTKGFYYVVSDPGSWTLDGISEWKAGDWVVYNGSVWEKIDNTESVTSVNSQTGAIIITASGIPYDNFSSGLASTDTQSAIDEIDGKVDLLEAGGTHAHANKTVLDNTQEPYTTADKNILDSLNSWGHPHSNMLVLDNTTASYTLSDDSKLSGIELEAKDDQAASEVPYDNSSSGLISTDLQSAVDEVASTSGDASSVAFTPNGDIATTNVQDAVVEVRDDTDTKLSSKIDTSEKAAANGVATLDGSGQLTSSQIPSALLSHLEYKGAWDAETNDPIVPAADSTNIGDYYIVSVQGITNISGFTDWNIGDWLVSNGTDWDKIDSSSPVYSYTTSPTSVDDISEGYSEGSIWVNTLRNHVFICNDSSLGNASWSHVNVGALLRQTGIVLDGGTITINGSDPTLMDVSAAQYFIQGSYHIYAGVTGENPSWGTDENSKYVGLDANGLVKSDTKWTDVQLRTILPLARLNTEAGDLGPGSNMHLIRDDRYFVDESGWRDRLWFEKAIGAIYYTGGEITENTSFDRQLDEAAGFVFDAQKKEQEITLKTQIECVRMYHVAGSLEAEEITPFIVPNDQWDNQTNLQSIPTGKWVSHTLLKSPKGLPQEGAHYFIYGDEIHNTKAEAENQEPFFSGFTSQVVSGMVAVASIVMQQGASNICCIIDRRPLIRHTKAQFGLGNVLNLKHNYAAIIDPTSNDDLNLDYTEGSHWYNKNNNTLFLCAETTYSGAVWNSLTNASHSALSDLGNDDHTQYFLTDGTRPVTGDLTVSGTLSFDEISDTNERAIIIDVSGSTSAGIEIAGSQPSNKGGILFSENSLTGTSIRWAGSQNGGNTIQLNGEVYDGNFIDIYVGTNAVGFYNHWVGAGSIGTLHEYIEGVGFQAELTDASAVGLNITGTIGTGISSTRPFDLNGNLINDVADPVSPQDAATKAYVDAVTTSGVAEEGNLYFTDQRVTDSPTVSGIVEEFNNHKLDGIEINPLDQISGIQTEIEVITVGSTDLAEASDCSLPDGRLVFPVNGDNSVYIFNPLTKTITNTISMSNPGHALYCSDNDRLYVVSFTHSSIAVINPNTYQVESYITTTVTSPRELTYNPETKLLYYSSASPNYLGVIDIAAGIETVFHDLAGRSTSLTYNQTSGDICVSDYDNHKVNVYRKEPYLLFDEITFGDDTLSTNAAVYYNTQVFVAHRTAFEINVLAANDYTNIEDTITASGIAQSIQGIDMNTVSEKLYATTALDTFAISNIYSTQDTTTISGSIGGHKTLAGTTFAGGDRVFVLNTTTDQIQVIDYTDDTITTTVDVPGIVDFTYDKNNDMIYTLTSSGDLSSIDPNNSWAKALLFDYSQTSEFITFCNINNTIFVFTTSEANAYNVITNETTDLSDNLGTDFRSTYIQEVMCDPITGIVYCVIIQSVYTGIRCFNALTFNKMHYYMETSPSHGQYRRLFYLTNENSFYASTLNVGGIVARLGSVLYDTFSTGRYAEDILTVPTSNKIVSVCGDSGGLVASKSISQAELYFWDEQISVNWNISTHISEFDTLYIYGNTGIKVVRVIKDGKLLENIAVTGNLEVKWIDYLDDIGLIAILTNSYLELIDPSTNQIIKTYPIAGNVSRAVYCTYNNNIYYSYSSVITPLDPKTGLTGTPIALAGTSRPNCNLVYDDINNKIGIPGTYSCMVLDVPTSTVNSITTPQSPLDGVFAKGYVYYGTSNGNDQECVMKINLNTLTYERSYPCFDNTWSSSICFDGQNKLYVGTQDFHIISINIDNDFVENIPVASSWSDEINGVIFMNDSLYITGYRNTILKIDQFRGDIADSCTYTDTPNRQDVWPWKAAYNPNNNLLYVTTWDKYVYLYNSDTLEYKGFVETSLGVTTAIQYSHLDKKMYVGDRNTNKVSIIS